MDLILVLIVPLIIAAVVFALVVRRGLQFKQLLLDGVPAKGVVAKKIRFRGRHLTLRYAYRDDAGRVHANKSLVTDDVWNAHEEGGSIDVVYSRSQPEISAPKYLVDRTRPAS